MKAEVKIMRFASKDFKEISKVTNEICDKHNATFVSLQVTKMKKGYACIFITFILYNKTRSYSVEETE